MSDPPTLERLTDDAWRIRLGDTIDAGLNASVHALAALLRTQAPGWLVDLVPAYASLAVFFDATRIEAEAVRAHLADLASHARDPHAATPVRELAIPVRYGDEYGPDLEASALLLGLHPAQLVERHSGASYTVAMIGFAPGFPYLLGLDPELALPRLDTPRARVPAGSVGIGGVQTGVYPRESPGGWRLLGRTPVVLFDPAREPPALVAPGDRVRFVPVATFEPARAPEPAPPQAHPCGLHVLAPGTLTTVQDSGRRGWRHLGVGRAGALDADAARLANRLVGNAPDAAVLEITLSGPRLRFERSLRLALCGADIDARFVDEAGATAALPTGRPLTLPPGELRLGAVRNGARAWLAVAGGIAVPVVLGSRSTDLRGGFGGVEGRALRAGDVLPLGDAEVATPTAPRFPAWWIDRDFTDADARTVRYVPAAAGVLEGREWRVSPHSDRQGLRLLGDAPAPVRTERVSAPVAPGTIQQPPDGQPIVLLADAQTTGGYPELGHVIAADLPRLAQLRPGEALRFEAVDARRADALARRRRALLARLELAIDARLSAMR